MIITYTVEGVYSWKRDKITTRFMRKPAGVAQKRRGKRAAAAPMRTVAVARTYRPDGDAEAKKAHADACLAGLHLQGYPDTRDQYAVHVIYSPANERAHDTDRVLTLVLDALTGVVWHDDSDKFVRRSSCEVVRGDKLYPPGTTTVVIERVAGPYVAPKKTRARRAA